MSLNKLILPLSQKTIKLMLRQTWEHSAILLMYDAALALHTYRNNNVRVSAGSCVPHMWDVITETWA